jgi:hypothetical protein
MAQLRPDHQKCVDRDAEIVVVGPDSKEAVKYCWQTEQLRL